MKKKLLVVFLAIIAALCCAFGLSACDLFGNNQGGNDVGNNQGGNEGDNQEKKLSVIGKTFYFSYVKVESEDESIAEKLTTQINSDMRGAVVKFFENGTADIGSGEPATWTQDGENVVLTSMGMPSPYKVTENTFYQSSNSNGVAITVVFTTEKPVQHTVTLINENPDVATVSGEGVYYNGETATIITTVNQSGYYFLGWYDGDKLVSTVYDLKAGYSFEVNSDVVYTAKWVYCEIYINNFSDEQGTITWNYPFNSVYNIVDVYFSSTTNSGYKILGYYTYSGNSNKGTYNSCTNLNNYTGLNGRSMSVYGAVTLEIVCITEYEDELYEFNYSDEGVGIKGVKDKDIKVIDVEHYVRVLDDGAFAGCNKLERVLLSDNLVKISGTAFNGCDNLQSIVFAGTYEQWQKIIKDENWDSELNDCTIEFTNNVNAPESEELFCFSPILKKGEIIAYAVVGVTDKYTDECLVIPTNYKGKPVIKINYNAFHYADSFTSVVIPEGIEKIDYGAFIECNNLETVYWNAIRCIAKKNTNNPIFNGCNNLTSVIFGDSVEVVRGAAFAWCNRLTDVQFSKSIKIIESEAFMCCALTSIEIPDNVIEIGAAAFADCKQLKSVKIGKGLSNLDRAVFSGCESLETVYFNAENCNDLLDWGSDLFSDCGIINGITITIGNSAKRVPDNFCNYMSSSNIDAKNTKIIKIVFEENSTCEYIGKQAFVYCTDIVDIDIPDSVVYIGSVAFGNCENLQTVYIGNGVIEIGEGAFSGCKSLKNFRVPDSIKKFEGFSYSNDDLIEYKQYDNAYYLGNENNPYVILMSASNQEIEECNIHSDTKIINSGAFIWCTNLESITIPEGVISVCGAFSYCYNIKTLNLPASVEYFAPSWQCSVKYYTVDENNTTYYSVDNCIIEKATKTLVCGSDICIIPQDGSIKRIGDGAFTGQALNVEELIIPEGVTHIGANAFQVNYVLTKIVLPESLTYIGNGAFGWCKNLKHINIPQSVTYIGQGAFTNCESLEDIIIPDSITAIYESMFSGCKSIVEFIVPENVASISLSAFWDCTNLESILIPDSVKSIDGAAFLNCENLKTVYYLGSFENWINIEIDENENESLFNATLYFYSETEPTEEGNFWHYVDGEAVVW